MTKIQNMDNIKCCQKCRAFVAVVNAKCCSHFGRQFGSFHKAKHSFSIGSSSHAPWEFPKGGENLCPHKNPDTCIYSSFIHNSKKFKATKISFDRLMNKQTVVNTKFIRDLNINLKTIKFLD